MAKTIALGQFQEVNKNIKTEILFGDQGQTKDGGPKNQRANKDVQIAFYLTKEDAAKLNIIHARLLAESGQALSRADRVRNLVLNFIQEHKELLNK